MSMRTTVQSNATDGDGRVADCSRCPWLTAYLKGDGEVISSGVITIEEADYMGEDAPAGAWSAVTTMNAADVTLGAQKAYHFTPGAYSKVRGRITTPVGGGGAITLTIVGNGAE